MVGVRNPATLWSVDDFRWISVVGFNFCVEFCIKSFDFFVVNFALSLSFRPSPSSYTFMNVTDNF